ncbi:hypothetical protein M071_1897 [Bacteroides fragilis str. Ds-233]|nr:hypothetical protein M071_1897 [Bacteroides fragilis str. Ds-233]
MPSTSPVEKPEEPVEPFGDEKVLIVYFFGSSLNLVVNSLFLYFQVDNCSFCLLL